MEIIKTTAKPPLTECPLVKHFLVGIHNEGYWTSNHMALQFEDVCDVLSVLFPEYEIVFIFDHSQGHDKKRDGGLVATDMGVNFGGAQPRPRDTQPQLDSLGIHSPKISVGKHNN